MNAVEIREMAIMECASGFSAEGLGLSDGQARKIAAELKWSYSNSAGLGQLAARNIPMIYMVLRGPDGRSHYLLPREWEICMRQMAGLGESWLEYVGRSRGYKILAQSDGRIHFFKDGRLEFSTRLSEAEIIYK